MLRFFRSVWNWLSIKFVCIWEFCAAQHSYWVIWLLYLAQHSDWDVQLVYISTVEFIHMMQWYILVLAVNFRSLNDLNESEVLKSLFNFLILLFLPGQSVPAYHSALCSCLGHQHVSCCRMWQAYIYLWSWRTYTTANWLQSRWWWAWIHQCNLFTWWTVDSCWQLWQVVQPCTDYAEINYALDSCFGI